MQFIEDDLFQVNFIVVFHVANFHFVGAENSLAKEIISDERKNAFSPLLINNTLACSANKASFSDEEWAESSTATNENFVSDWVS
jgi:hypothetical protein